MRRALSLIVGLVLPLVPAVPSAAGAQQAPAAADSTKRVLAPFALNPMPFDSVQVGMLTLVTAGALMHRRAALVEARFGDTLVLRGIQQRELVRVPRDRLEWMQVGTGRGRTAASMGRGAAIGLGVGLILARLVQYAIEPEADRSERACPIGIWKVDCGMTPDVFLGSVAIGVLGGAAVGGEIGGERWRLVRLP